MKWNYSIGWVVAFSIAALQTVSAATNYWQDVNTSFQARSVGDASSVNVMVKKGRRLTANLNVMRLGFADGYNVAISLPLPDGSMTTYQFSRSSVMSDELAMKYPEIQTFKAFDINNPANRGSFDITPQGFHGMFQHNGKWVFIDPENRNDNGNYVAYYGTDAQPFEDRQLDEVIPATLVSTDLTTDSLYSNRPLIGTQLRTYRLAMAAAAEYTSFHGGKTLALAAINTLISRVNEVYERDLSIKFQLVANNDDLVYVNSRSDPYNNTDDDATINRNHIPTVIPNSDFDIGHVLNTSNGGSAQLSGVCRDGDKSVGVTGTTSPTGNAFYIDYVAHELGHQLGANHTFNGTAESCSGRNRSGSTAWEPGSGSTIMGYAGICGTQNLQLNSDAYFHTGSIEEILGTAAAANCGTLTAIQNTIPIADAGDDFTIPANTPFKLTGSGSDADGDTLSYTWEQFDLGTASSGVSTMVDNGSRPLFRSKEPSASPERYFPNLVDYSSGTLKIGESMPTTNRDLSFRLTVRDGKGGVATDEMIVTVSTAASALRLTAPTSGADLQSDTETVITWEGDSTVAGCASVDIMMSENGDENFDVTIVQSTPNDGEFGYTVSSTTTSDSVIMLSCSASGLFALSSGGVTAIPVPVSETATPAADSGGGSSVNALSFYFGFILLVLIRRFRGRKTT